MEQVVSTIMFDGQFWIILVEKYQRDGKLLVGKHIFGPEPTYADIRCFFMNEYHNMRFNVCDTGRRIKKQRSRKEIERNTNKSFSAFSEEQKKYLQERKKQRVQRQKADQQRKFELKREKRKQKKRGH